MWPERTAEQARLAGRDRWCGRTRRHGFVYFHAQCTAPAVAGHGLIFLPGGFEDSSATTAAIGQKDVAALGSPGPRRVGMGADRTVPRLTGAAPLID
ncbi:hypothetical protein ADL21_00735 [Streptomyces albus subsp. albus]|nr:hypothetical protein ADL21_00735 [Streptomyces albus subsp. albus]